MQSASVNARHVKNVPGRKSDVSDCQWLQYLYCGRAPARLLPSSCPSLRRAQPVAPPPRRRGEYGGRQGGRADTLIRSAASHVQHMLKALTQMNIQLANVISDLPGKTGLAIIDAILAGERDGEKLATLRDHRIKADTQTIAKSLRGDWRQEHLFTLRQARATSAHDQQMVAECDAQIAAFLRDFESRVDVAAQPLPARPTSHVRPQRNAPSGFDLRGELDRILGGRSHPGARPAEPYGQRFSERSGPERGALRHAQTLRFLARPLPG